MGTKAKILRALIESGEPFIAGDAYSALTGRILQHVGFKAAYLGGASCGAMHYAVPDFGVLSQAEQIEQASRIADAIDIPLVVDADTLGETVADAFHFTRRYVKADIAGFHVEDEVNPKHSRYDNGLLPIADMQAKIDACTKARGDSGFVIIARCDELYPTSMFGGGRGSVEEAIARGKAYIEAGADVLAFPIASADDTAEVIEALSPFPVCTIGPRLPGAAFCLSTGWGWTGAAQLHYARARTLLETGELEFDFNVEDRDILLEERHYGELVAGWAGKTGRPVR